MTLDELRQIALNVVEADARAVDAYRAWYEQEHRMRYDEAWLKHTRMLSKARVARRRLRAVPAHHIVAAINHAKQIDD